MKMNETCYTDPDNMTVCIPDMVPVYTNNTDIQYSGNKGSYLKNNSEG